MTSLLSDAVARLAQLPERDQEFYARQLLTELDADARWDELFSHTSDEDWRSMVEGARRDADAHVDSDTLLARLG